MGEDNMFGIADRCPDNNLQQSFVVYSGSDKDYLFWCCAGLHKTDASEDIG